MKEIKRVFTVGGKPFFSLGGQAHNSSGYGQEFEAGMRAVEMAHGNTLAIPITWEQIEPAEGQFDLSAVDTLLGAARDCGLRLVILWFATWKNGMMKYAPAWVKADTQRFRRVISAAGHPLPVLSSHCTANRDADAAAFCQLLAYLKEKDGATGTVIGVQVENEPGSLGSDRDYGEPGEAEYRGAVPQELMAAMKAKADSPIYAAWQAGGGRDGGTWEEVFGWSGGEVMTTWSLAAISSILPQPARPYMISHSTSTSGWPSRASASRAPILPAAPSAKCWISIAGPPNPSIWWPRISICPIPRAIAPSAPIMIVTTTRCTSPNPAAGAPMPGTCSTPSLTTMPSAFTSLASIACCSPMAPCARKAWR